MPRHMGMTTPCEYFNHLIGLLVPFPFWLVLARSIPFFFISKTKECPTSSLKLLCVDTYFSGIRDTCRRISILCPINVIEHRHKWNSSLKLFWIYLSSVQIFLDLSEKLNRCESKENIPLQLVLVGLLEILNLFFPLDIGFYLMFASEGWLYSSMT